MTATWTVLTTRYGREVRDPTPADLLAALDELFHEALPGMTEADYAEHPSAWLRVGRADGGMSVVEVFRGGRVEHHEWADTEYDRERRPVRVREGVVRDEALAMWVRLPYLEEDERS